MTKCFHPEPMSETEGGAGWARRPASSTQRGRACGEQGWHGENSSWLLGRVDIALKDEQERVCFIFDKGV